MTLTSDMFLPRSGARRALAKRLGLHYDDRMQDWEHEVADAERFDDFLRVYRRRDLSSDELASLMEMLIQCAEDLHGTPAGSQAWTAIESWLISRRALHRGTIDYWACEDEREPESMFGVSGEMRRVRTLVARMDATMDAADAAWNEGDLDTAFARFREAADLGDPHAMLNLGYFHDEGLARPRSRHDAMRWYRRAVRLGDRAAATNIAILFRERSNARSMLRWFTLSARSGDGDAHVELARCHRDGLGARKWPSRAIAHARLAARSTCVTPAGRDEARALLASLSGPCRRHPQRIRRHR
jgi:hypothetical protein